MIDHLGILLVLFVRPWLSSAANGAANLTMSSVVTLGVDVAKVTCLGHKVVLSQLIVVFVTAPPLSVLTVPGRKLKIFLFQLPQLFTGRFGVCLHHTSAYGQ